MKPKCGCGRNANLKGIGKTGKKYYRSNCLTCRREAHKAKKGYCERCLVVPFDKKDLDVDHIDGNRANNELNNLQTLCKPCHKIKTKEHGDYKRNENLQQLQAIKTSN
jgi:5-methylcytosine-specific restriction endonuclease McrA